MVWFRGDDGKLTSAKFSDGATAFNMFDRVPNATSMYFTAGDDVANALLPYLARNLGFIKPNHEIETFV